jgi:hypothetical protein
MSAFSRTGRCLLGRRDLHPKETTMDADTIVRIVAGIIATVVSTVAIISIMRASRE